ncbi:MAG: sigma 54-interacting transcriptional regulator [Desulfovibrio sp.]|jgi:Nif-specific regulatory protein|nr:sigma 54-interacting transcriptional regulator [Desulfovibrio sp.]
MKKATRNEIQRHILPNFELFADFWLEVEFLFCYIKVMFNAGVISTTGSLVASTQTTPEAADVNTESQLRLLFDLTQVMNSAIAVEDALDAALVLMAKHMHMMRGSITLISPQTGEIRIESSWGLTQAERQRGRYRAGEGVIGRVIMTGKPMYVTNVFDEPLFLNKTRSRNLKSESISFICVPIRLCDRVGGALSVDHLLADAATLEEEMRLLIIIAALLRDAALQMQLAMDEKSESARPKNFVGNSEKMEIVYTQIAQVASSATTVFLHGESGTGKELAAKAIHIASARARKPFISLNCATLPETLVESEIFGHERGAFTGANAIRKGRFELANGGTLFLDEVGELPLLTQAKLLRVLQERSFERLGGMETIHVDVRFITATNRNLEQMVEDGLFRRDLYYRLNVFPINLPPLRERTDDILPLATHFLQKFAEATGRRHVQFSEKVREILQEYFWPGNIRELENVMERTVLLLGQEHMVFPQHLPLALQNAAVRVVRRTLVAFDGGLQERMDAQERSYIVEALEWSCGKIGKAASHLGLTERVMGLRIKKYGLNYKGFRRTGKNIV